MSFTTSLVINFGKFRENSEDNILVNNSFFEVFFMSKDIFLLLLFQNHNEFCFGCFIEGVYINSVLIYFTIAGSRSLAVIWGWLPSGSSKLSYKVLKFSLFCVDVPSGLCKIQDHLVSSE